MSRLLGVVAMLVGGIVGSLLFNTIQSMVHGQETEKSAKDCETIRVHRLEILDESGKVVGAFIGGGKDSQRRVTLWLGNMGDDSDGERQGIALRYMRGEARQVIEAEIANDSERRRVLIDTGKFMMDDQEGVTKTSNELWYKLKVLPSGMIFERGGGSVLRLDCAKGNDASRVTLCDSAGKTKIVLHVPEEGTKAGTIKFLDATGAVESVIPERK